MAAEYGMDDSSIACAGGFVPAMRDLCGKPFTIVAVHEGVVSDGGESYNSLEKFEWDDLGVSCWFITTDMLEYAEGREFKPESYDSLESLWG